MRFAPGEVMGCEYRIEIDPEVNVTAIETSVLWMTHGKGQEDIGVHFFERRENKMVHADVLRQTHKLSTKLPMSPLSYDGEMVKISWGVRVRLFLADGTQQTEDYGFLLGDARIVSTDSNDQNDSPAESKEPNNDAAA